jgi:type II secretory pathway predicted ATPase ExeA
MSEAFFDLTQKPFALLPDPDFLFDSLGHREALRWLEHGLATRAEIGVITAEMGCGKTTLIHGFIQRLPGDVSVGIIVNTNRSFTNIAEWALMSFKRKPVARTPQQIHDELILHLIAEYANGRRCLLIIDEAQNLTVPALDDLRRLSSINSGEDFLLQILLVGQPKLLETLRHPALAELAERISVSYEMPALSFLEVGPYVRHRLALSGCERSIFTEPAIADLHFFSDGIPRLINMLCDRALVYAFANDRRIVDADLVRRVVADRQASGIAAFVRMESLGEPSPEAPTSIIEVFIPTMPSERGDPASDHQASDVPEPLAHEQVPDLSESVALTVHSTGDLPGDRQPEQGMSVAAAGLAHDDGQATNIADHQLFATLLAVHRETIGDLTRGERIGRKTGNGEMTIPSTTRKPSLRRRFLPHRGNI